MKEYASEFFSWAENVKKGSKLYFSVNYLKKTPYDPCVYHYSFNAHSIQSNQEVFRWIQLCRIFFIASKHLKIAKNTNFRWFSQKLHFFLTLFFNILKHHVFWSIQARFHQIWQVVNFFRKCFRRKKSIFKTGRSRVPSRL